MWVGGGKPGLWSRWGGGIERWSPILGASPPVTKLSGKRGMVISAFSFGCSGESSTQLSKTSPPFEGCLNFRRVKKYRKEERVWSSGPCGPCSVHRSTASPVGTPHPTCWPCQEPNSEAVSRCNGCGHYSAQNLGNVLWWMFKGGFLRWSHAPTLPCRLLMKAMVQSQGLSRSINATQQGQEPIWLPSDMVIFIIFL